MAIILSLALFLGFLNAWHPAFDTLSHFRAHLAVLLGLTALPFFLASCWMEATAVLVLAMVSLISISSPIARSSASDGATHGIKTHPVGTAEHWRLVRAHLVALAGTVAGGVAVEAARARQNLSQLGENRRRALGLVGDQREALRRGKCVRGRAGHGIGWRIREWQGWTRIARISVWSSSMVAGTG